MCSRTGLGLSQLSAGLSYLGMIYALLIPQFWLYISQGLTPIDGVSGMRRKYYKKKGIFLVVYVTTHRQISVNVGIIKMENTICHLREEKVLLGWTGLTSSKLLEGFMGKLLRSPARCCDGWRRWCLVMPRGRRFLSPPWCKYQQELRFGMKGGTVSLLLHVHVLF